MSFSTGKVLTTGQTAPGIQSNSSLKATAIVRILITCGGYIHIHSNYAHCPVLVSVRNWYSAPHQNLNHGVLPHRCLGECECINRACACRDMTRVFLAEKRFDWNDHRCDNPAAKKPRYYRPPHPVTVKCKVVLKKIIDLLELPPNPLDLLTHLCGGRQNVAEMTGRKEIMEWMPDGRFHAVKRADEGSQQNFNLKVLLLLSFRRF